MITLMSKEEFYGKQKESYTYKRIGGKEETTTVAGNRVLIHIKPVKNTK